MVSIYEIKNTRTKVVDDEAQEYITVELRGLSDDDFPTQIGDKYVDNGSVYVEIDTGKLYFYNLDAQEWVEFGGSTEDNSR